MMRSEKGRMLEKMAERVVVLPGRGDWAVLCCLCAARVLLGPLEVLGLTLTKSWRTGGTGLVIAYRNPK